MNRFSSIYKAVAHGSTAVLKIHTVMRSFAAMLLLGCVLALLLHLPLLLPSHRGHVECMHAQTGFSSLGLASQNGHGECVQALLEKGANPNQVDAQTGSFPLLLASEHGHGACVQALLEKGADPIQVNAQTGSFPFDLASQNGHAEGL
jgi:ankyrin repeat protein